VNRDESQESLATQAAAWVPPWERERPEPEAAPEADAERAVEPAPEPAEPDSAEKGGAAPVGRSPSDGVSDGEAGIECRAAMPGPAGWAPSSVDELAGESGPDETKPGVGATVNVTRMAIPPSPAAAMIQRYRPVRRGGASIWARGMASVLSHESSSMGTGPRRRSSDLRNPERVECRDCVDFLTMDASA